MDTSDFWSLRRRNYKRRELLPDYPNSRLPNLLPSSSATVPSASDRTAGEDLSTSAHVELISDTILKPVLLNRRLRSGTSDANPDSVTSSPSGTSTSQLPIELTLIVLGTGVAIGLLVIGVIWCVCYMVNRRYYAAKERKKQEKEHEQRLLGYSGPPNAPPQYPTQYLYISGSGKDKEKQRSQTQLSAVPLPTPLPTPVQVQVQLVHTDQGVTTESRLLGSVENLDFDFMTGTKIIRNGQEKSVDSAGFPLGSGNESNGIMVKEKINTISETNDAQPPTSSRMSVDTEKKYINSKTSSSLVQVGQIVETVTVDRSTSASSPTILPSSWPDNQKHDTGAGFLPDVPSSGTTPGTPGSSNGASRLKHRTSSGHPLLHPNFHSQSNEDLPIPPDPDEISAAPHQVISPLATSTVDTPVPGPTKPASPKTSPSEVSKHAHVSRRRSSGVSRTGGELKVKVDAAESPLASDPCVALWNLRAELETKTSPGDCLLLSICSERSDDGNEPTIRLIPDSESDIDPETRRLQALLTSQSTTTDECYASTTPISDDLFTIAKLQAAAAAGGSSPNVPVSLLTSLTSFESNTPSEESFDATSCAKALEAIFDEPSDLPGPSTSKSAISGWSGSSGTHLTPPVQQNRQKRKQTPPKLTSHQKRQSFKKAHHLAADRSSRQQKDTTSATEAVVTKVESAIVAIADPTEMEKEEVAKMGEPTALPSTVRPPRSRSDAVSPSRLQQMKNDSGYKSQSFDTATASHSHAVVAAMQSYKSVPVLPGAAAVNMVELQHIQQMVEARLERELLVPDPHPLVTTSSECDDLTDCSVEISDAFISLTSSMETDPSQAWRSSTSHSAHHKSIPLVRTLPATPTSPSPASRDWAIDAQSDRLFREFTQAIPKRTLTPPAAKSGNRERGRERQGRLPGAKPRSKLKSYSPSSSHGGSSAQASIEETEEEETSLSSGTASTMSQSTVIQVEPVTTGQAGVNLSEDRKDSPVPGGDEAEKNDVAAPLPDFFICSTREQVTNRMSMRSRSPQLRHVPIIKLPDQESEEV